VYTPLLLLLGILGIEEIFCTKPRVISELQLMWKALRSKGIPDIILQLITALHENTGARIRVGQKLSLRISTTSGVRQGCILAPILFCVAIDWII